MEASENLTSLNIYQRTLTNTSKTRPCKNIPRNHQRDFSLYPPNFS